MKNIRLIDANSLKKDFADMRDGVMRFSKTEMLSTSEIAKTIDDAPTIEPVDYIVAEKDKDNSAN